jgi:hypothetical protein
MPIKGYPLTGSLDIHKKLLDISLFPKGNQETAGRL